MMDVEDRDGTCPSKLEARIAPLTLRPKHPIATERLATLSN